MEGGGFPQLQNLEPNISSSIIASRLDQLASAFYANECHSDFQQQDSDATASTILFDRPNRARTCSYSSLQVARLNEAQLPLYQSPMDDTSVECNLQEILRPYLLDSQNSRSLSRLSENVAEIDTKMTESLSEDQIPSLFYDPPQFPSETQNALQQEKSSIRKQSAFGTSRRSASSGSIISSSKRIRWSKDLHKKFVKCVNSLGGAEKATPKAILKLMESKGLTILQVKSHLQKFRTDKFMSKHKKEKPESEKALPIGYDILKLYRRNIMEIRKVLQLQLDAEKHLHEQLEIQRNLQLQIEESGRQLKLMLEQQQIDNQKPT